MRVHQEKKLVVLIMVMIVFLSGWAGGSQMDYYLGSQYKGNYVWGGAMNLAWHNLTENVLHESLRLNSDDQAAVEMVDQLNRSPFTGSDLDEKSYYARSGFGQKTVDLINRESRQKFPGKSFQDLSLKLSPVDIISYACFLKEVEYLTEFEKKDVLFANERVKGFCAKGHDQRENVRILRYWDDDRFIVSLKLKDDGDELFLAKGFDMKEPRDSLDEIASYNKADLPSMGHGDLFEMPNLHLDHHRDYKELIGKKLANKGFEEYLIGSLFENIKFDMDNRGARVENEAVIAMPTAAPAEQRPKIRKFILDKPFWVVMKRRGRSHPYFILGVNNTEPMEKIQ